MPAMLGMGFNQKNDSRESDGILGKRNEKGEFSASVLSSLGIQRGEEGAASISGNGYQRFDFDLNKPPDVEEDGIGVGFVDDINSVSRFCEQETENRQSSSLLFGVNLKRIADDEEARSPRKRKRFSYEEKGKAKAIDDDQFLVGIDDGDLNLELGLGSKAFYTWPSLFDTASIPENNLGPEEELMDNLRESELRRSSTENNPGPQEELVNSLGESEPRRRSIAENNRGPEDGLVTSLRESELRRRQEEAIRQHDNAKDYAQRYHESQRLESAKQNETGVMQDQLPEDSESPFGMAMEMIKKRNSRSGNKKNLGDALKPEFKWVPTGSKCHDTAVRCAPSLLDLSLNVLAKNSEAIESLEHVPEVLRHKLSEMVCDNRKMDAKFLELLARGSPTEIRAKSCSQITDEEFSKIFGSFDTKNLIVLQLDNCGPFMHDHVLHDMLAHSSRNLPALVTISLSGAYRLSDNGLKALAESAPALKSINLSQCSLLTSAGINNLARCFESTLRELYLDECQNIDAMDILPALKKLKCLEVLSVAGIESVSDDFVIEMVEACGKNMKELVFNDGGGCPALKSLVLDSCEGLTAVRFCSLSLVNLSLVGCRAITALELVCPHLEKVCLDGCEHLERASFSPVALQSLNLGTCPKLYKLIIDAPFMVSLELKGCGVLSEASINSPCLTTLDASFCSHLNDDCLAATTSSCPRIESLILMSCPSISSGGLYSLACLPNLTTLDLSYTFLMNLQPVFGSCLRLKVLKLQACKYLADSSLEPLYKKGALPALQELDLSYGTLCQSAIEELLAYCTHLTHVSLNGCVNMHDLNWGSSGGQLYESLDPETFSPVNITEPMEHAKRLLQNLNCVGCPNIRKVLIPPAARCLHLSSLNLSLSINLKEVGLACLNLSILNLSNCCSLEVLKLDCPRLTSLFLQSCNIDDGEVGTAISHCNTLETLDVRFCPKICSVSLGKLQASYPNLKRIFSSLSTA